MRCEAGEQDRQAGWLLHRLRGPRGQGCLEVSGRGRRSCWNRPQGASRAALRREGKPARGPWELQKRSRPEGEEEPSSSPRASVSVCVCVSVGGPSRASVSRVCACPVRVCRRHSCTRACRRHSVPICSKFTMACEPGRRCCRTGVRVPRSGRRRHVAQHHRGGLCTRASGRRCWQPPASRVRAVPRWPSRGRRRDAAGSPRWAVLWAEGIRGGHAHAPPRTRPDPSRLRRPPGPTQSPSAARSSVKVTGPRPESRAQRAGSAAPARARGAPPWGPRVCVRVRVRACACTPCRGAGGGGVRRRPGGSGAREPLRPPTHGLPGVRSRPAPARARAARPPHSPSPPRPWEDP